MSKILVVEDELTLQNAIKTKLTKEGYDVVSETNAKDALQTLHSNEDIKLIWLDHYLLGDETGFDFLQKIKVDDKYKMIPVFLVSNTASNEKVQAYMHLGVDKYYIKSNIPLREIIDDIKQFLN